MKNNHYDDDDDDTQNASFCWWRTTSAAAQNTNLDLSNLSALTPNLRLVRELERLNMVAREGLDEVRHKLLNYRCGDFWLRAGGIDKKDMEIPPMITLLLIGLNGGGKSSLVNLMYSVLGRSGLIPFAQTSCNRNKTILMEEHNVLRSPRSGFCIYDSRGIDKNRMDEGLDEVYSFMVNGVRHYQLCSRAVDDSLLEIQTPLISASARFVTRPVNATIVVADMVDILKSIRDGDSTSLEATRELFNLHAIRKSNENPILVLTHGDLLTPEERFTARLKICEYLSIPETTGVYDIPCLTEQGILAEEADPVTSYALCELVYRALMQADRSHLPKRKVRDWIMLVFSWIMWCIGSLFAILAYLFAKLSKKHKLKVKRV